MYGCDVDLLVTKNTSMQTHEKYSSFVSSDSGLGFESKTRSLVSEITDSEVSNSIFIVCTIN